MLPPPERPKRGTKNSRVFCANFGTTRDLDLPRFGLPKSPVFSHGTQRDAIFPSNRGGKQTLKRASRSRPPSGAARPCPPIATWPSTAQDQASQSQHNAGPAPPRKTSLALGRSGAEEEEEEEGGGGRRFFSRSCLDFQPANRLANSRLDHPNSQSQCVAVPVARRGGRMTKKRKIGEH